MTALQVLQADETASGVGIPPCTALRACRVPCQEQESPPVPLIILPKSCSCRCGPCPPPLSLVWSVFCFFLSGPFRMRDIALLRAARSPLRGTWAPIGIFRSTSVLARRFAHAARLVLTMKQARKADTQERPHTARYP